MRKKILLVKSNAETSDGCLHSVFVESGHRVKSLESVRQAMEEVTRDGCDLIVSDLNLPRENGIELLKKIKEINPSVPVILTAEKAGVADAVKAIKLGASDFLLKPLTREMADIINAQLSNGLGSNGDGRTRNPHTIITQNSEMNRLLQLAREIADSRASVMIQGESGTGKELFARYIHDKSSRKDQPFVAVNCAALPENLLESELFGHEKGAFTGAVSRKKGKFESADQGTLLLDEISEMDFQLQAKLLRVLQEREIDRVGGTHPVPVDVRIIATTNRDIEACVEDGLFRADLFYRLNVIPIKLPPLRERRDDLPLLAEHFIQKFNRLDNKCVKGLTEPVIFSLSQQPWKGNIRELENVMERLVLTCRGDQIDENALFMVENPVPHGGTVDPFMPLGSLKEMEKHAIFQVLDKTHGNRTHAAEILGISVRTLRNKLSEYREKMTSE